MRVGEGGATGPKFEPAPATLAESTVDFGPLSGQPKSPRRGGGKGGAKGKTGAGKGRRRRLLAMLEGGQ